MNRRKQVAITCIAVVLFICGCQDGEVLPVVPDLAIANEDESLHEAADIPPISIVVTCVGDVMVHKSQIAAQYDSSTDTYDYSNNFVYVKKYIENSDLALCNLETTFGGKPYTGYPVFSAPDELAKALKATGFDVAMTANNHMMDRGVSGLTRTISVLQENGILATGSREEPGQPEYVIIDVNGVKVCVIAYTYAASSSSGDLLINGSAVSRDAAFLINYFRYDHIDEDLQKINGAVNEAKKAGADIVIVYYHWGEEFQLKPNERQRYIAERTAGSMDVDIIFASHPHTPQEISSVASGKTGVQVPVYYSLGNFISNQRVETLDVMNKKYTEIGAIARVVIDYDKEEGEIVRIDAAAIPTWVEKYRVGGRDIYAVVPLDEGLEANESLAASGHLGRAKKAWEDANGILGID